MFDGAYIFTFQMKKQTLQSNLVQVLLNLKFDLNVFFFFEFSFKLNSTCVLPMSEGWFRLIQWYFEFNVNLFSFCINKYERFYRINAYNWSGILSIKKVCFSNIELRNWDKFTKRKNDEESVIYGLGYINWGNGTHFKLKWKDRMENEKCWKPMLFGAFFYRFTILFYLKLSYFIPYCLHK